VIVFMCFCVSFMPVVGAQFADLANSSAMGFPRTSPKLALHLSVDALPVSPRNAFFGGFFLMGMTICDLSLDRLTRLFASATQPVLFGLWQHNTSAMNRLSSHVAHIIVDSC